MFRLIPAIVVIVAALIIPAPAVADELEADAIMATLDCAVDNEEVYLADVAFAKDCHGQALETLGYLSPDVSYGCVRMWNEMYAFHAVAYAGYSFSYDIDVVSPLDSLDNDFELIVGACLSS